MRESVEQPCERDARQQELNDHRLHALFAPITSPRRFLPTAFNGQFPLLNSDLDCLPRPLSERELPTFSGEEPALAGCLWFLSG